MNMDVVHAYLENGQFEAARDVLRTLLAYSPQHLEARRLLGRLELHLGQAESAFVLLMAVAQEHEDTPELAFETGLAALAANHLDAALDLFATELRLSPHHAGAHFNTARVLCRLGRGREAVGHWRQVTVLQPDNADGWFNLGNTLFDNGDMAEAAAACEQARRLAPERTDVQRLMAAACQAKGDIVAAEGILRSMVRTAPGDAVAVSRLGRLLVDHGRAGEAKEMLAAALGHAYHPETAIALGHALLALGELAAAKGHLTLALAEIPDNAWGWQVLALVTLDRGEYAEADDALAHGRSLDRSVGLGGRFKHPGDLWRLHPDADLFYAHGGQDVPPPSRIMMALTNKCNLRCDICGSQGWLDKSGSLRQHMPIETFRLAAQATFPTATVVELNSRGEPLLYPQIEEVLETIRRHRCLLKLQTNGTMFTDRVLDILTSMNANISISVDAIGPLFDEVRTNGKWEVAEPRIRQLAARCDGVRQVVQLYPTITARTVSGMLDLVRWAADCGIPYIEFHPYLPTPSAKIDREPDHGAVTAQLAAIRDWKKHSGSPISVSYDGERITDGAFPNARIPSVIKHSHFPYTIERPAEPSVRDSHPTRLCAAPFNSIEIGLFGEVSACCRSSMDPLGIIDSTERFAEIWLGRNFKRVRDSLMRDAQGGFPLPSCTTCVPYYAPDSAARRQPSPVESLDCDFDVVPVNPIGALNGFHGISVAAAPVGLRPEDYRMFEDGMALATGSADIETVQARLGGAWSVHLRMICFTSGDGSDPQRDGRKYVLRRLQSARREH